MSNFNQIDVENLSFNLEKFYKKFYINRLVKGVLFSFGFLVMVILFLDLLVFYGNLPTFIRFGLFYGFVVVLLSSLYFGVLDPVLRLLRLTKGLTENEVAKYVGSYYDAIGDKLINTLQLEKLSGSNSLVKASIDSRVDFLDEFDFSKAVPKINRNKSALVFILPIALFIGLFVFNNKVVTQGSSHLINYSVDYSAIAPFEFNVLPGDVDISSGDDFEVSVVLVGESIPSDVFVEMDGVLYRAIQNGDMYEFGFSNARKDVTYRFKAGKYFSESHMVHVVPVPVVDQLVLVVDYPEYTKKERTEFINPSLIEVPYGSEIFWESTISNCEKAHLKINDSLITLNLKENYSWNFRNNVSENILYEVILENKIQNQSVGTSGKIVLVIDEYPSIDLNSQIDSSGIGTSYFMGNIEDDYGFYSLRARFIGKDTSWTEAINISGFSDQGVFSFSVNHSKLENDMSLFFEVRDNDVLNGYKLTKSVKFSVRGLNSEEIDQSLLDEAELLEKELEDLVKESKDIDDELSEINKDLLEKKQMDWETQQRIKRLMESHQSFQNKINSVEDKMKEHHNRTNDNQEVTQEILDKQKQLQKLFDELMDDETKKLFKELEELLKQMDKDKIQEHLDDMKMNQEEINKELDRNLEIFKQLELEMGMEKAMEDLSKLAEKQKELAEKNESKEITNEENVEKQEKLNKEFDKLKEDLKRLDSLNKDLKKPNELDFDKEKQEEVSEDQKEAVEKSKEKDQKKSSESQKDAAEKMEDMEESLGESMDMNSSEQASEDMEALRRLLENLLELSFEQEELLNTNRHIAANDPSVVGLSKFQKQLLESSVVIKDSLFALSSRIPQIDALVAKETKAMTVNMEESVSEIVERNLSSAGLHQQLSLTAINNLAVLLDEIIQQMQQEQQNKNQGTGSCSKPGQGSPKPSMKSSKKKQKELSMKMEQMKKELEKGNSPGKMNPGKMGEGMSKEVAKLAAQQELIRNELRKLSEQLQKEGDMGGAGSLKELERLMEENEEDIINLELDQEFLNRQNEIESKLLEAENAQRQRELDEKRESENMNVVNPAVENQTDEYIQLKEFELELLRLFNPSLSGYYKGRVRTYNSNVK